MNKTIHHYHSRRNYTSLLASRLKCDASLWHSLRMALSPKKKKTKKLEWDKDLAGNNLIWCNGKLSKLDNWSEEERLEFSYRIAPVPRIHNQKRLQTQLRQYRLKMKKAVESEIRKGNQEAAEFLQTVLDSDRHVPYSRIDTFAKLNMQRKKQRIKMLETYLNAYNQLQQRAPTHAVYLQEGLFRIPHKWEVGSDIISLEEYIEFTRQFLTDHFPEYPIKGIIGHDDERGKDQKTGLHTHYFLSGRNSATVKYDLHKKQVQVVNDYIEHEYSVKKFFPKDGNLTHKQSQDFGRYFQKMIRDYANNNLYNPKGLHVVLAPETERQSDQRKQMNKEAKLPKSERSYNFYSHQLERAMDKLELTEKKYANLLKESEQTEQELKRLTDESVQTQIQLNSLRVEKDTLSMEVLGLGDEKNRLSGLTEELTQDVLPKLVNAFKQVLLAINARDKGMKKKQSEYLMSVLHSTLELPPLLSKSIADEVTVLLGEDNCIVAQRSDTTSLEANHK